MKRKHKPKPRYQVNTAKKRIKELLKQAASADKELAERYVKIARDIAKKFKVRIPASLKKKFCKHCGSYFRLGDNCRVRINEGKMVYYCKECKHYMRFPYKKKK